MHGLQLKKFEEKLDQTLCIFLLKEQKMGTNHPKQNIDGNIHIQVLF
jgi:hypothetical protein